MLLRLIEQSPIQARQYLERWVNDGSPSGFSEINRSSPHTDPYGSNPWFHLNICSGPADRFLTYGTIPTEPIGIADPIWILLHPDTPTDQLRHSELSVGTFEKCRVSPTASSRTVQIIDKKAPDYIKLHYEGVLGRVHRALPYLKAVAGVEISREILCAMAGGVLPESFAILPEVGARSLTVQSGSGSKEIGMVWRSHVPHGRRSTEITHLWPTFALFSTDRLSPLDPALLTQLVGISGLPPVRFLLEKCLFPILSNYWELVLQLGFQVECNTQNVMVGLTKDFEICAVVIRDLARFEKDLPLRSQLGLRTEFDSSPHKCISEDDGELYRIRHSFAFDFKLCEYILDPFIWLASEEYGVERGQVEGLIKEFVKPYLRRLPEPYFPENGLWYKHERVLLTQTRPYVGVTNPRFR